MLVTSTVSLVIAALGADALRFVESTPPRRRPLAAQAVAEPVVQTTPSFGATMATETPSDDTNLVVLKAKILQAGATLDRGQGYNPTSGEQYKDRMDAAVRCVDALVRAGEPLGKATVSLEAIAGPWELVFSSVPHGIFRSSPFFLAIDAAYRMAGAPEKAELFFKLHELQTCSWGASKIGRVGQTIDAEAGVLYSEFDTQLFALTVIPILGWFKLLPTFGGCVVTASKILGLGAATPDDESSTDGSPGGTVLDLEVDYTTAKPVDGLPGLGEWIWNVKVPVGLVWRWLPWNKGRAPTCAVTIRYADEDFRVVQDAGGEYFVYTRPVLA
mmetsp:Transcript_8318/g.34253  ORF Transcript_8318/g.34253 Transcript_8318/m.34253 type:complete len:329 (+) Transcript_8318:852-1838(+)